MKQKNSNLMLVFSFGCLLSSCMRSMSESVIKSEAGLNGGFEKQENGLPLNWLLYTPNTVAEGDFKWELDTAIKHEGSQSLHFSVISSSGKPGRFSPGFSKEIRVIPGKYLLSVWIRNRGCNFRYSLSATNANESMTAVEFTSNENGEWIHIEREVTVPSSMDRARLEINLLSPGEFWVDDLSISKS